MIIQDFIHCLEFRDVYCKFIQNIYHTSLKVKPPHGNKVKAKHTCIDLGENELVTFDPSNYHVRVNLKGDNQQKMKADILRNILRVGVNFYKVVPGGRKFSGLRR